MSALKVTKKEKLALRMKLYLRDNGLCQLCMYPVSFVAFTIDHKIPVALGGKNRFDNLQISHATCNQKKADFTPEEYYGLNEYDVFISFSAARSLKHLILDNSIVINHLEGHFKGQAPLAYRYLSIRAGNLPVARYLDTVLPLYASGHAYGTVHTAFARMFPDANV